MARNGGTGRGREEDHPQAQASACLDLAAELARTRGHRLLDLATGVLVAQQALEPDEAAESLGRLASGAGLSLADLAADIVNGACGVPAESPDAADSALPGPRARRRLASAADDDGELDEVAASLLDTMRPIGVCGLLVWRRTAADCLRLVGAAGFSPLVRSQWAQIPPQWRALPQQALTGGVPIWLPDGVEQVIDLPGPSPEAARAVLPLRYDGHAAGVVLLAWRESHELDTELRRRVVGLLEVLARVLSGLRHMIDPGSSLPILASMLDLLAEPAMMLRRSADRPHEEHLTDGEAPVFSEEARALYVEHVNTAAHRLGSGVPRPVGRPLAHVLPVAAQELTELVADAYRQGSVRRATRIPRTPARQPAPPPLLNVRVLAVAADRCVVLWHAEGRDHSFSVLKRAGRLGSLAAFEDDTARGVTQWSEQVAPLLGLPPKARPLPLDQVTGLLVAEDRPELARMLDAATSRFEGASAVVRIPRPDGGVRHVRIIAEPLLTHGTLTGLTGFFQDVSTQYQTEAALEATFDALGSAQEQAALRHRLALQLQRAIMPEQPDFGELPGLRVAVRYRPAGEEYRVGGDWYDVLTVPDGRAVIAVGDVAGHGIDAANGMVALRNSLRGLACSGMAPGRLMRVLNEVSLRTDGHPTATAVCGRFDPGNRVLRWTSAGHLPTVLLRDGRPRLLDSPPNLLLGAVPDVDYDESQVDLRTGDLLLLFTDGLIERRQTSLDDALAALSRNMESLDAAGDLDAQADELLALADGDTGDDTSLVLVRLE